MLTLVLYSERNAGTVNMEIQQLFYIQFRISFLFLSFFFPVDL